MVKAYYKNSKGEVLWLTKAPFKTVESDWFDSSWEDSTDGLVPKDTRIRFVRSISSAFNV